MLRSKVGTEKEWVRKKASGFTLIEMVMVISLLGIIGVLVLPILDKPFWIYQAGSSMQHASSDAVKVMHWIEKDIVEGNVAISRLPDGGVELSFAAGAVGYRSIGSKVLKGDGPLMTLYRYDRRPDSNGMNDPSAQGVIGSPVADNIDAFNVEWRPPFLSVTLVVASSVGESVSFWRQWTVEASN